MQHPKDIKIADYTYQLPNERIANFPLAQRDASKLLVYKNEGITNDVFSNLAHHLPAGCLVISNNSKVIKARLFFFKSSGAKIEILLLEPADEPGGYLEALAATTRCQWKCYVGGAARWKDEKLVLQVPFEQGIVSLIAAKKDRSDDVFVIEFRWDNHRLSFAGIIELAGKMPLPPYIRRLADEEDEKRYQTIFSEREGSVAAPTAGLHFTPEVLHSIREKGISRAQVTLHVGAGTFKPVSAVTMDGHTMHAEYVEVKLETIREIIESPIVVAIGTTSLRTIESLYWMGCRIHQNPNATDLDIVQWEPYESGVFLFKKDALETLLAWMLRYNRQIIFARTQIIIAPGYQFKIANYLVTNFHQPGSTLLLLVAAAVGKDWKKIYDHALINDYRFLSYGDSNLLQIQDTTGII